MSQATADSQADKVLRVKIAGMDCGSCALTIENSMRQLAGVRIGLCQLHDGDHGGDGQPRRSPASSSG